MRELAAAVLARVRETRQRLLHGESGQGLVEYALIIAVVSLGAVVALGFLSGKINTLFSKTGNSVNNVTVAADSGSGGPPPAGVPSPGTAAISCSAGSCEDDNNLNGSTAGWSSNGSAIINYTFQWQFGNDVNDGCSGVTYQNYTGSGGNFTQVSTTVPSFNIPADPGDFEDVCWRLVVNSTNGVGPSTSPAISNAIYVQEND